MSGVITPHLVGAGHEVGGALPVTHGAADVGVGGHHHPQAAPAPPPAIHGGVDTAQHRQLQTTTTCQNWYHFG